MDDHDAAAAEAARVQAEARRKKILEKADKRMGVVSGEETLAEDDKKASAAKAARIRAARQRRYGKKSADTPAKEEPQSEPKEQPTETVAPVEATQENPPKNANESPKEEIKKVPEEAKGSGVTAEPIASSSDEPKKKYVGVARMRRNMIKNKKKQEDSSEPVDGPPSVPASAAVSDEAKKLPMDPLKLVSRVPIYMHILTILLLFFAGMDVSFQQYHQQLEVESNFALSQHGILLINRSLGPPSSIAPSKGKLLHNHESLESLGADGTEMMDEFEEDEAEDTIPNIDPVFGVDLDELTKGPGVVNQLARGAVVAHRSIVWLVYFLPLSMIKSLLSMPQALMRSPPTLCLVALALRNLVGKGILGAGIPEPSTGGEKGGAIDLIAMAKSFVTSFFNNNFPTAVSLYGAFNHLRADMYVILCGVFSGLVYIHLAASATQPESDAEMPVNDEL